MRNVIKVISVTFFLIVAHTAFTGCSDHGKPIGTSTAKAPQMSVSSNSQEGGDEYTIRVATTFTGADPFADVWQEVLSDFRTKYPRIKIVDDPTPAAGDAFKTRIATDFASGNEPDVTFGFNGNIGDPICKSGKVITWDNELKADPDWAGNFNTEALESSKWLGKLYCLPYMGSFEGMWINKDLFEISGVDIPKTYNDILALIPVFKSKGIAPIVCSFAEEPHYLIETFILSAAGKEGHSTPFDPSWAKGLNYIKDLYDKGAFNDDALIIKQSECVDMFVNKKAAMFISGSWSAGNFKDKENIVIIPLPSLPDSKAGPRDIIGVIGEGWYLTKELNTQKDGSGMKFIKYMTSPEIMGKYASVGCIPCIKCTIKADTAMRKSFVDFIGTSTSINKPLGDMIDQESFTALWNGLSYVVSGRKTSEQLVEEARKVACSSAIH